MSDADPDPVDDEATIEDEAPPVGRPKRVEFHIQVVRQLPQIVAVCIDEVQLRFEREIATIVRSRREDDSGAVRRDIETIDQQVLSGDLGDRPGREADPKEVGPAAKVLAMRPFVDKDRIGTKLDLLLDLLIQSLFGDEDDALAVTRPFVVGDLASPFGQGLGLAAIQGHEKDLWLVLDFPQHCEVLPIG